MKIKSLILLCIFLITFLISHPLIQGNNLIVKEKDLKFIYSLFEDNKFGMALTQIEQFFKQYPQATETDDIKYLNVECLFLKNSYKLCLETSKQYLSSNPQFPYQAELSYRIALSYFYLNDLLNATTLMKEFQKTYPTHILSHDFDYWLGVSLYQQNDFTGSQEYLKNYLKKPDSEYAVYASYSLGKIHQMQNNPSAAIKLIEPLTGPAYQNHPIYPQSQALLPELYYQIGQYQKTIDFVQNQTNKNQTTDQLLYLKGISHLALKQYPACITVFQDILKKYPKTEHRLDIYSNTLQCHYLAGNYASGSTLARKIITTEKTLPADFYYWFLLNAIENGDTGLAQSHLTTLKKLNAKQGEEIVCQLADYWYRKKQYQQTVSILDSHLITQPTLLLSSRKQLGDSYYQLKNYDKALQAYDAMISGTHDPKQILEPLFVSALCEYQLKNYKKSMERFTRILNQYPYPNDYYEASVIYNQKNLIETGDYQAMENLVGSLSHQPEKKEHLFFFHYYQGYAAYLMNKYPQSIEHLNRSLTFADSTPEKAMVHTMIGDAYFNSKNFAQAIAYYQKSDRNAMTPEENSKMLYQTGMAYLKLKNYDQAILQFKEIYLSYPMNGQADEAYYYHGRCLFLQEKYQESLNLLKSLTLRFPKSGYLNHANFQIADAYYNLKDYDQSFIFYRDALNQSTSPEMMEQASKGIEWSLQQNSNIEKSLKQVDNLLKENANPKFQMSLMLIKIRLIRKTDQKEQAIGLYNQLLTTYPEQTEMILPDYLQLVLETGRQDQARELLNTHLKLMKNDAQGDFMKYKLAELEFQSNQFDRALANIESILSNSPQAIPAMLLKGKIYAANGRQDSADSIFINIQNQQPQGYYARVAYLEQGKLYLAQKKYEQAEQLFQEIIASSSGEEAAASQFYIGEIKYEQQDYNLASTQYLKVQYIYDKFSNWAEKAVWKSALCDIQQNHLMEAKEKLNTLKNTSVDTTIQRMANEELKKIE